MPDPSEDPSEELDMTGADAFDPDDRPSDGSDDLFDEIEDDDLEHRVVRRPSPLPTREEDEEDLARADLQDVDDLDPYSSDSE